MAGKLYNLGALALSILAFQSVTVSAFVQPRWAQKSGTSRWHAEPPAEPVFELNTEWKGNTKWIERRGEVPSPDYEPSKIAQLLFARLQLNDEPQLDNGAAVVVGFASPENMASSLNPTEFGNFMRQDDALSLILDNSRFSLEGSCQFSEDNTRALQKMKVVGYPPDFEEKIFDVAFSLSEQKCWLLDSITVSKQ
uniref:Uncharacterized protein n=1 Tax=Fibrocapsa japonica TaxID=94617 RepID=A0A7S2V4C2_9STRA|mmetsp:Transcript_5812/g.8801  ORF Transcript_5812/g.8801 Transcript_5812/m.8801 type:complete len:195 (+) Transcript_5812:36-620(+)